MSNKLDIRKSRREEIPAIESLYPEAFPDENLIPLVRDLLNDSVVAMSLVGTIDTHIVGHAIFTRCKVVGDSVNATLLGPLVVAPAWHRQGFGTAIVRAGFRELESAGVGRVFVLGDPAYYGRLGFLPDSLVAPPYPLPPEWDDAWQSRGLGEVTTSCSGKLAVPPQWLQPSLWAP
jgi:putative acetyltransferase